MSFKQFGGKNKFNQSKEITTNSIISDFSYSKNATVQDTITISEDNNLWNINTEFSGSNVSVLQAKPEYRTALFRVLDNSNNPIIHINANNGDTSLNQPNVDVKTDFFVRGNSKFFDSVNFDNRVVFNVPIPSVDDHAANKKYVDDEIAGVSVGTLTGNLDMCNNNIVNLADPTAAQDAATRNYVNVADALKLDLIGGTLTGTLNALGINANEIIVSKDVSGNTTRDTFYRMNVVNSRHALGGSGTKQLELDWYEEDEGNIPAGSYAVRIGGSGGMSNLVIAAQDNPIITFHPNPAFGGIDIHRIVDMCNNKIVNLADPTAAQDAATRNYVNNEDALKLNLTGGTLTGNLNMSNNRIENVADVFDAPVFSSGQQAVNKNYVDNPYLYKFFVQDTTTYGNFAADPKWSGGVLAPNGKIYYIPLGDPYPLVFNPNNLINTAVSIGNPYNGNNKWVGGVLSTNGKIYCVPYQAQQVLEIDPTNDNTLLIGPTYTDFFKWYGGVLAPNGNIYGVPSNAEQVLRINPNGFSFSQIGTTYSGSFKWYGGVLATNGKIYCVPYEAQQVLEIDPSNNTTALIGTTFAAGGNKWVGGVLGPNGKIYCVPGQAQQVMQIDTTTNPVSTSLIGSSFGAGFGKWHGGVLAPDGKIYCMPYDASAVLVIDTSNDTTTTFGSFSGSNKWLGGVLAPNGNIYCVPHDATNILIIGTGPPTMPSWMLSAHYNKL